MRSQSAVARVLKWLGLGLLVLLLVLAAGLVLFDWNTAKPYLASWVSGKTGRDLSVADIAVDPAINPRITLHGVELENAPWGRSQPMLTAQSLDFRIKLLPLLHGEVVFPSLNVEGARLLLERNAEGKSNWDFVPGPLTAPAVEPVLPEERPEIPQLRRFSVTDSTISYSSPAYQAQLRLDRMQGQMSGGAEGMRVSGTGALEGKPLDFSLQGGGIETLRDPNKPYPVSLQASLGKADLNVDGSIVDPLGVRGLNLDVTVSGRSLADLHPVIPLPLPPTPVYRLETGLHRDGLIWGFDNLSGVIGKSDLSGNLTLDLAGDRPAVEGTLTSQRVHPSDIKGIFGAPPRRPDLRPGRLFSHRPIDVQYLQAADMQLRYRADRITETNIPLSDVAADIGLTNGVLDMQIERAGVAGGTAHGRVRVDSTAAPATGMMKIRFSGVHLGDFLPASPFVDASEGRISGHGEISGAGRSVAALMGNSNGTFRFAMSGGTLDNTLVEAIGLDVAELLTVLSQEGSPTPIRCAAGVIRIDDGIARPDPLVIDTQDSLIVVDGKVDLKTEKLDLSLQAQPKDPSLFEAKGSVSITGTMVHPQFGINAGPAVGQVLGATALAALINPLAAIAPFIDPGSAEDAHCGELLKKARSHSP